MLLPVGPLDLAEPGEMTSTLITRGPRGGGPYGFYNSRGTRTSWKQPPPRFFRRDASLLRVFETCDLKYSTRIELVILAIPHAGAQTMIATLPRLRPVSGAVPDTAAVTKLCEHALHAARGGSQLSIA